MKERKLKILFYKKKGFKRRYEINYIVQKCFIEELLVFGDF